ncbi:hypothetical protein BSK49_24505 [Paenibacillus odorifer]|uniref:hypothetical protein n=1 Tax=Paenibacillus odorifer TaxID=189426 RepID=UPI00096E0F82|nr:hypothetical protein [Paenibacillus odorifer]OMD83450.1 hypothetical protein BSK49_24505 [Paenibacillus odorifer]
MISITPVRLTSFTNLNEIRDVLQEYNNLDKAVQKEGWPTDERLTKRWYPIRPYEFNITQRETGTGEIENFIVAEAYTERVKFRKFWFKADDEGEENQDDENEEEELDDQVELVPKKERITVTRANCIFFELNAQIFCAILLSPGPKFKRIVKDLLPQNIWGETIMFPPEFQMPDDLLYWLLNKFINGGRRLGNTPLVFIREWLGFHGTTQDNTHRLTGEGEQISAILGTLAFLFMNDPLKALSLDIQYEDERLTTHYGINGNCKIDESEYQGVIANRYIDMDRQALLILLIYKKIIPSIVGYYDQSCDHGEWNEGLRREFTEGIGQTIIQRIRENH